MKPALLVTTVVLPLLTMRKLIFAKLFSQCIYEYSYVLNNMKDTKHFL
jgi:hypothetical protein